MGQAGHFLGEERRDIMIRRGLVLTALYLLVNTPGVWGGSASDAARLRDIHIELDAAVLDAYGWSDGATHGFHTYRKVLRWTVGPAARAELLDRLLEENHRRARWE